MANPVWQGDVDTAWDTANNWDTGSAPADTDAAYMYSNAINVASGFAQSAVTLALLEIMASYTGRIGTTGIGGSELAIGATICNIGRALGTGSPAGSDHILLNFGSAANTTNVYKTASAPADANRECLRIRGTNAANILNVFGGLVGVATNDPDDTATYALNQTGGTVNLGIGVTLVDPVIRGSGATLNLRNGVTSGDTMLLEDGTVNAYDAGTIPTLKIIGGTFNDASSGTYTAVTVFDGGTLNVRSGAKTYTTLNLYGTLDLTNASGAITVTTFNVLSNNARVIDPYNRLSTPAFVFGAGVTEFDYQHGGGLTLTVS